MTTKSVPIITIDGPGGAGKGTICQLIAKELQWHLLDSGKLYRLLGLASAQHQIDVKDEPALATLAEVLDVEFVATDNQAIRVSLEGADVTELLHSEQAGARASAVAALPRVREALLARQRSFAQAPGLVADGRDMGTVVFTDAPLKIYLTASVEERAKRRYKQLKDKGQDVNLARLAEAIAARDHSDMNRPVAPLKPAEDALQIDSTEMSINAVCETILAIAADRHLLD